MYATAAASSSFSLFPCLPAELRIQIWHYALPSAGPALFFYRKGLWRVRPWPVPDPEIDPENHPLLDFGHEFLVPIQIEVPPAFVNHEARDVALPWARAQRLEPCPRGDRSIFLRLFDPKRDALYVPPEKWRDFVHEPDDRSWAPDLYDKTFGTYGWVTHLALPEALIRNADEMSWLDEIFTLYYESVRRLLVVVDAEPETPDERTDMQPHWGSESAQDMKYSWNAECRRFDLQGHKQVGHDVLDIETGNLSGVLGPWLVRNRIRDFEIRPVVAVRISVE